jgi:hypothetical protein
MTYPMMIQRIKFQELQHNRETQLYSPTVFKPTAEMHMDTEDSIPYQGIDMDDDSLEVVEEEVGISSTKSIGIQVCMSLECGTEVVLEGASAQSSQCLSSQASAASSVCNLGRIDTVPATQSCCFICKNKQGRHVVSKAAIRQVWTKLNMFVPRSNRCCRSHLNSQPEFDPEMLDLVLAAKPGVQMKSSDFREWLDTITTVKSTTVGWSFEEGGLDADYKLLTGVRKEQFDDLYTFYLEGFLKNSSNRSPRDALGMLLMLLRSNLTQAFIGRLFQTTQPVVSTTIKAVTSALMSNFVPRFLGVDSITYQEINTIRIIMCLFSMEFPRNLRPP